MEWIIWLLGWLLTPSPEGPNWITTVLGWLLSVL